MSRALPTFLDRLQTVCELGQAGTYFEEGGCWGMTLALHDHLTKAGIPAQIQVQTEGVIHPYVVAEGQAVDYRGAIPVDVFMGGDAYTPHELIALAGRYGASPEVVANDRHWSGQFIAAAEAWMPPPKAIPVPVPVSARRRR